jgi:alpha-D-ribose 1-methylphosphonate 5-triphosphate diphosphatase
MTTLIIRNATIVATEECFIGTVLIEDGVIRRVDCGDTGLPDAQDWAGDWLMPGLVELHTDNLRSTWYPAPACSGMPIRP